MKQLSFLGVLRVILQARSIAKACAPSTADSLNNRVMAELADTMEVPVGFLREAWVGLPIADPEAPPAGEPAPLGQDELREAVKRIRWEHTLLLDDLARMTGISMGRLLIWETGRPVAWAAGEVEAIGLVVAELLV